MNSLGLTQVVNTPTRVCKKRSTLIDHVWTKDADITTIVEDFHMSDHFGINIEINCENNLEKNEYEYQDISEENIKQTKDYLSKGSGSAEPSIFHLRKP